MLFRHYYNTNKTIMKQNILWNKLLLTFISNLPQTYIGYIFINILLFIPCIIIGIIHIMNINFLSTYPPYKDIDDKVGLFFNTVLSLFLYSITIIIIFHLYLFIKHIIFSKTFLLILMIVSTLYVITLVYKTIEQHNFKKIKWN